MLIREWMARDNIRIAELERVCFSFPWTKEMIEETFVQPNFKGVVAEKNGIVVGYAGGIFCADQCDIALVAVSPEYRRQKIAENLLNQLIAQLIQSGVRMFFLEVRVTNLGARALYEKLGFNMVGIRKNYYEDAEDAIVMLKEILVE